MIDFIKKYIGDKHFYKMTFLIIIPIVFQQLFTSIAGYIDGLMINSYLETAYSGVSAANKLMFIVNFILIGFSAACGIFYSQYFGAQNKEKLNESLAFSLIVAIILSILGFIVITFFGNNIVDLYIQSTESREFGYRYLSVMRWGMLIISFNFTISSALRSTRNTILPMVAGIIDIIVNICLNYVLIFGHFGAPVLDSMGAAIATVISRTVSLVIMLAYLFFSKKSAYKELFKTRHISKDLIKSMFVRGTPLVLNELFWSLGTVLLAMFYTYKNDFNYTAYSYAVNITDLFFIFFAGLGNGTAILIGNSLGAGDFDRSIKLSYWMRGLAIMFGLVIGAIMIFTAPLLLNMFKPTPEMKIISVKVLRITAIFIVLYAYNSVNFFILRSGGDSIRALSLDQGPTWLISLPITAILGINSVSLGLTLPMIFLISHIADIIKFFVGNSFVSKRHWVVNLTLNQK